MNRNEVIKELCNLNAVTHPDLDCGWVRGLENGNVKTSTNKELSKEEFWSDHITPNFDEDWTPQKITIIDHCVCGQEVLVELNTTEGTRSDNVRPHYEDSKLPDFLSPTEYNQKGITCYVCRNCDRYLSDSVSLAFFRN